MPVNRQEIVDTIAFSDTGLQGRALLTALPNIVRVLNAMALMPLQIPLKRGINKMREKLHYPT